jgi:hypothetical protein
MPGVVLLVLGHVWIDPLHWGSVSAAPDRRYSVRLRRIGIKPEAVRLVSVHGNEATHAHQFKLLARDPLLRCVVDGRRDLCRVRQIHDGGRLRRSKYPNACMWQIQEALFREPIR